MEGGFGETRTAIPFYRGFWSTLLNLRKVKDAPCRFWQNIKMIQSPNLSKTNTTIFQIYVNHETLTSLLRSTPTPAISSQQMLIPRARTFVICSMSVFHGTLEKGAMTHSATNPWQLVVMFLGKPNGISGPCFLETYTHRRGCNSVKWEMHIVKAKVMGEYPRYIPTYSAYIWVV